MSKVKQFINKSNRIVMAYKGLELEWAQAGRFYLKSGHTLKNWGRG